MVIGSSYNILVWFASMVSKEKNVIKYKERY